MKVKITKIKCKRCGYEWIPRKDDVRMCPKCHSPYWDREKQRKKRGKRRRRQGESEEKK